MILQVVNSFVWATATDFLGNIAQKLNLIPELDLDPLRSRVLGVELIYVVIKVVEATDLKNKSILYRN